MGYRYHTGDRVYGGSMEPRLNPTCVDPRLNAKLRPSWPSPMVRETSMSGCVKEEDSGRKARIGTNIPRKQEY
jgi:hypothetical protein